MDNKKQKENIDKFDEVLLELRKHKKEDDLDAEYVKRKIKPAWLGLWEPVSKKNK